jgi:hypothetical protein
MKIWFIALPSLCVVGVTMADGVDRGAGADPASSG